MKDEHREVTKIRETETDCAVERDTGKRRTEREKEGKCSA